MKSSLYIKDSNYGLFYNDGMYCYPYESRKVLLHPAKIIGTAVGESKIVESKSGYITDYQIVFFEDYFDIKTRTKRGRLFKKTLEKQPVYLYNSNEGGIYEFGSGTNPVAFYEYRPYQISRDFDMSKPINISLGYGQNKNKWELIQVDEIHTQEEVLTLKNIVGFRDVPILDQIKIPEEHYPNLLNEYTTMIDEMTSLPESVIDHCRDFATQLLIAKLETKKEKLKDLNDMIKKFDKEHPKEFKIVKNCANIIARLHPRRKPNEYKKRSLSQPTEFDADLAIKCSFAMIRELGWDYGQ